MGLALGRPADQSGVSDEFVLRWAREDFANAIDFAFADSRVFATTRTVPAQIHASPGDSVLSPMGVYEIHDPAAIAAYAAQKAKLSQGPRGATLPTPALTEGVYDLAIDPTGPAGPLQPSAPFNEAVLYHALPAAEALEILYSGVYEHSPRLPAKTCGAGVYFSDTVAHADRFAGDTRDARRTGEPGAVLAGHLRLSDGETRCARFMLVCRVLLGNPATASSPIKPPYDACVSAGEGGGPIYAPRSNGRRWAAPYSSLVAQEPNPAEVGGINNVYVLKGGQAARCLPIAVVAYRHIAARWDELGQRQIYS